MKKLTTLLIAITALLLGTATVSAAPKNKYKKVKKPYVKVKKAKKNGLYNGHYNRRGVYIYHQHKFVNSRRGVLKNTYKHKIFPNGRHKVNLVNRKLIAKNRYNSYKGVKIIHKVERYGWRQYLVTYKIKRTWYGMKKKIIKKKRLYNNQYRSQYRGKYKG